MVSSLPDNNCIYEKAVLWKCKHNIRFISPLTGEIVEYPVFSTNSTQYGTGEADKTNMSVGEDQHLIYIPYNKETIMLDDRFRFLMDKNRVNPTAYRITKVDPVSYAVGEEYENDGLIQWSVLEDQFNGATDNAELMVADYYPVISGGVSDIPGESAQIVLTDLDGDFQIALGETKQIRVQILDTNGNPIVPIQYQLEYNFDGAADVVDEVDGIVTLKASDNPAFVGKRIEIKVINNEFSCEAVMKIQVVNW